MPSFEEAIESRLFPELEEHIETLRAYYQVEATRSIQRTERIQGWTRGLVVLIVLLSLVQGAILLFGIQRWLVRPLAEINRSTAIISTGDFEHRVVLRSYDEMGDLAQAVNRMAKELRQSQARLVESERLAALGELVGYIAHNIRNPLASMRAAAQGERNLLVGACPAMRQVFNLVERFSRIGTGSAGEMPTVLILGETGTGKGLVARAIHARGPASQGPFVEVNCTTLPKDLIEAELFGYEKGAFTGAA